MRNLDLAKKILVEEFSSFKDNDITLDKHLDPLLSKNPFFTKGADWRISRTEFSPLFTATKVIYDFIIKIKLNC